MSDALLAEAEDDDSSGEEDEDLFSAKEYRKHVWDWTSKGFPQHLVMKAIDQCGTNGDLSETLNFILALQANEECEATLDSKWPRTELELPDSRAKQEEQDSVIMLSRMGFSPEEAEAARSEYGNVVNDAVIDFLHARSLEERPSSSQTPAVQAPEGDLRSNLLDIFDAATVARALRQCEPGASEEVIVNYILENQEELGLPGFGFGRAPKRKYSGMLQSRNAWQGSTSAAPPTRDIGFGVPGTALCRRQLPRTNEVAPFFYFENVKSMPRGEWENISRFLDGIAPEFVDSKYFCAASRPRGYIHNLPIETRKLLLPEQAKTIRELLSPEYRCYIPEWDTRTQLQCITKKVASGPKCQEVSRKARLDTSNTMDVLAEIKEWNLVWNGNGLLTQLEVAEVEKLQGFDVGHTRCGISLSEKYGLLGSSFQVNTVAWHLSVLKPLFPQGIKVLSLFSGIGGAEVALDKLGIPIAVLVTVEINSWANTIMKNWWSRTKQRGIHRSFEDVRSVTKEVLEDLVEEFGTFDLLIGGSPCNNLSGVNRHSRNGLAGKDSCLFFEFSRILVGLREIMNNRAA